MPKLSSEYQSPDTDKIKHMILKKLFARKPDHAERLYGAIVAAARQAKFYANWHVPDTLDGRFDMISLHVFLVLDRLRGHGKAADDMRQRLTDTFFLDMDRSLREMGVGDLSVGKKVRKMAEVFYGRVKAYAAALEAGGDLDDALRRNVYADVDGAPVAALADWVREARSGLQVQAVEDVLAAKVMFP